MAAAFLVATWCCLLQLATEGFVFRNVLSRQLHGPHCMSSYGPNDQETPEERQARMELVRKIQSNFYQKEGVPPSDEDISTTQWLQRDPNNPTIIANLPLWRVQWTELPGYQNVLNVHVPHYTHMFRKIILQHPKPWFFGSVYLPEGSKNLGNPDFVLPDKEAKDMREEMSRRSQATLTGTLMQIADYREQEDGRLTLIVQGVGRFKILEASQQVPYAVANVKILPDKESWEQYLWPLVGSSSIDHDMSMALIDATQNVAAREGELFRDLEYHQTLFGSEDSVQEVSPLSNVNGTISIEWERIREESDSVFAAGLTRQAEEIGSDEILLSSSTLKLSAYGDIEFDDIVFLEKNLWIELDRMIRLLQRAKPGMKIPVPAQMLGLLPTDVDWPSEFQLDTYAEKLEADQIYVGTHTKSPFVRLSRKYRDYPDIRRASRLSYVVWVMLSETIDMQQLLETSSIIERLQMANDTLKLICGLIQKSID